MAPRGANLDLDFPRPSLLMPRIFDNIDEKLLPVLQETLKVSDHADFCVGYFNLRGWRELDSFIEPWPGGEGHCCRLLIGMQKKPVEELQDQLTLSAATPGLDNSTATRLRRALASEFRDQLTMGAPTNEDEAALRRLASQIRNKKLIVKLFLDYLLHAKLYLAHRSDLNNPTTGFVGSSNLTLSGLAKQGELNVDVVELDAAQKLAKWFEARWADQWCLDISDELLQLIDESWARELPPPPYHIYLKMAYHLSEEARAGLSEFRIPKVFGNRLFEFQKAAVKIAAHHLNKRGGVLLGDVVGLGKTLMGSALAKVFEDDFGLESLIICPKNLVPMWEDYRDEYRLRARVLSLSLVTRELPELRKYRIVLIDESHNLRNPETKTYKALREYLERNESKCILLSATPYNKTYLDPSSQLRLFVAEDRNLGIRPERLLRQLGETEFIRRHQSSVRSIAAFEQSDWADDWRDLMRLFLVRRTRSFIMENYAALDPDNGRRYLTFEDGTRSYFPTRKPRTIKLEIDEKRSDDQYGRLYAPRVVNAVNALNLPRYGLGNYTAPTPHQPPTPTEENILRDLSRAGKRLMGFCRTNLFKRLESGGDAFILSIKRHILRNLVYLHAIENDKPLPIGTQDSGLLDSRVFDEDADDVFMLGGDIENDEEDEAQAETSPGVGIGGEPFESVAPHTYEQFAGPFKRRFKWLRPSLFVDDLAADLREDTQALLKILKDCGDWKPEFDQKLKALLLLLSKQHPKEKVIVFTQFADTVRYLEAQLKKRGLQKLAGVTGSASNPTLMAWRFSPESNGKRARIAPDEELRVLIATDVLSEGQNLQDCAIVVNYDLPWALIRLIQRAGRVDRIGQRAEVIDCYSFLPADGVERIINLRSKVRRRIRENAEVVGTDEAFFEDDRDDQVILDLYSEKAGILDGDADTEVDLASYAYQIWKNAITQEPELQRTIQDLPPVVYSTKPHAPATGMPEGVLVFMRTAQDNDVLAWIDQDGNSVSDSQLAVLQAAECTAKTPTLPRQDKHHELVRKGVERLIAEEKSIGGQLGRPSGARFRAYERLKNYAESVKGTIFESKELERALEDIYRFPLTEHAKDTINRQLKSGITNQQLAEMVIGLRDEVRLCVIHDDEKSPREPRIICSLGLVAEK